MSLQARYLDDILGQPDALRRVTADAQRFDELRSLVARQPPRAIVLTGMGASLAALRPAWLRLVPSTPAWLVETSELVNDVPGLLNDRPLVIAASQSGESAELVALIEQGLLDGASLVALTNDARSRLAGAADAVVDVDAGPEHAVSTRSYTNTLAAADVAVDVLSGGAPRDFGPVAAGIEAQLERWRELVDGLGSAITDPDRLFYLARGASLAAASCGALIAKEAAKCPVEAMSSPQFRHGPMELADDRLSAVILAGVGRERELNARLRTDLERLGAHALWVAPGDGAGAPGAVSLADVPEHGLPIAEIVVLQLLSVALAERTGVPAGVFRHLDKVTTVE